MSSALWEHQRVTMAEQIRSDVREESRRRLREEILDAAAGQAASIGWSAVRLGAVADQVGISRQTLHANVGTKEALGQAVVQRETERVLAVAVAALERRPDDPVAAVAAAVADTLHCLAGNALLQTMLADPTDPLLPLLTSRSRPLIDRASQAVAQWAVPRCPAVPEAQVLEVTDSLIRLTVSHAVLPTDPPDEVAGRLARLFRAGTAPTG
jgi:AcrR family transcriptional regulator